MKDINYFTRNPNSTVETAPTVLTDDDGDTFWNVAGCSASGLDTLMFMSGANSFSFTADASTNPMLTHTYGTPQVWTAQDIISIRIYGANSGWTSWLAYASTGWTDFISFAIVDDFTGWKTFHFLLRTGTVGSGSITNALAGVKYLQWVGWAPQGTTQKIDRVILDVFPGWANVAVAKTQRRGVQP